MHACSVVSSLFVTLWIVACQAPLSMGFPRQKYWSGLPFSPPGDLTNPGIKPSSSTSPLVTGFCTTEPPGKPTIKYNSSINFVSSFLLFFFFFFTVTPKKFQVMSVDHIWFLSDTLALSCGVRQIFVCILNLPDSSRETLEKLHRVSCSSFVSRGMICLPQILWGVS